MVAWVHTALGGRGGFEFFALVLGDVGACKRRQIMVQIRNAMKMVIAVPFARATMSEVPRA